jgi:hypothetical protein
MNLFYESLNSPTQIRYNTMEWLFSLMEKENLDELLANENEQIAYSQEEKILALFQIFTIDETKDNILGYSTQVNNNKAFINLLNFTIKYLNIKQNKNILNQEIDSANKLIDIINKNKIELFKKNIRLFISLKDKEKNKLENSDSQEDKINIKKINESINNCKNLIEKVDKKLEKLKNINLNESNEQQNVYDKLELKKALNILETNLDEFLVDFNENYEKELKYINPDNISHLDEVIDDLLNEYKKIENVACILEEIFAIHNKIIV